MKPNCIRDISKFSSMDSNRPYFLDTNILYWYCYPNYALLNSNKVHRQSEIYINFVDNLVYNGNPIFTSVYNMSELLYTVEKNEFELYKSKQGTDITLKDFRRITNRSGLKTTLLACIENIKSICKILDYHSGPDILDEFASSIDKHHCDNYDYIILKNCIADDKTHIISDDADFATMDGFTLYTANSYALSPNV